MGYRFRLHARDLPGTPDIVLPRHKKVVLVHGCFWHQHSRCKEGRMPGTRQEYWVPKLAGNVLRDLESRRKLRHLGWKSLVVWECELQKMDRLESRLQKFLHGS
jgi:DNA mismatch endonuclease (patch repair protein)